ncbi:hypothetical protein [Subtercola vilae]|uniref:hypothetical protein n=1 Tax=Subtercola vilae TaxID=2056433 RepID=UPI001396B1E8|nr:hypothetical protein [Subtercola vilae]
MTRIEEITKMIKPTVDELRHEPMFWATAAAVWPVDVPPVRAPLVVRAWARIRGQVVL